MKRCIEICLLIAFVVLPGCGYYTGTLIASDVKTVHVKMFDNDSFRHELEVPLTEAIKNEITRRTNLRIVDADSADSVLDGAITRVDASVVSQDADDRVFSQTLTVALRFQWRERRSGRVTARELYDHDNDPGETVNLAARREHAAIVRKLEAMMKAGWQGARPK